MWISCCHRMKRIWMFFSCSNYKKRWVCCDDSQRTTQINTPCSSSHWVSFHCVMCHWNRPPYTARGLLLGWIDGWLAGYLFSLFAFCSISIHFIVFSLWFVWCALPAFIMSIANWICVCDYFALRTFSPLPPALSLPRLNTLLWSREKNWKMRAKQRKKEGSGSIERQWAAA